MHRPDERGQPGSPGDDRRGRRYPARSRSSSSPPSSASRGRVSTVPPAFEGTPTKRSPSSSYWLRPARRRLEHRVAPRLGLRERHDLADVRLAARSAAQRSMPRAIPPCGGRRTRTPRGSPRTSLAHALERLALEQEAALEQVAAMDPHRAAAELPAVEREVVLHRAGAAGRVVRRRPGRVARRRHEQQASSSGTTPLNGLWVASQRPFSASHWYIGKRLTQT